MSTSKSGAPTRSSPSTPARAAKTPANAARKVVAPARAATAPPSVSVTAPKVPTAPKVAKAANPAKPAKPAKPPKAERKAAKPRAALVRDSFTMPEADFALIATLKGRAMTVQREAKKSELLRAGLRALAALDAAALKAALDALAPIKIGRPKKGH